MGRCKDSGYDPIKGMRLRAFSQTRNLSTATYLWAGAIHESPPPRLYLSEDQ